jgi:hypothetical protein
VREPKDVLGLRRRRAESSDGVATSRRPPRKLAAQWNARLRASGFEDLEGPSGALSDRGNLHPVTETEDAHVELAHRIEFGAEYYRWAQAMLHTYRFRNPMERRIWERHASGEGLQQAANELGVTYHAAYAAVNAIKRQGKQGKQGKETHKWPARQKPYRALSWDTSVRLAAAFLRTLTPSSTQALAS